MSHRHATAIRGRIRNAKLDSIKAEQTQLAKQQKILSALDALLQAGWTQASPGSTLKARNQSGIKADPTSPNAVSFTFLGALERVTQDHPDRVALSRSIVQHACVQLGYSWEEATRYGNIYLAMWNDAAKTTRTEILKMMQLLLDENAKAQREATYQEGKVKR